MSDADFDTLASQLLKDIGVNNTEALNFFQAKPHSTEWKTSIKVPSPPKARRTASSGTTRTHQTPSEPPREIPHQNGTSSQTQRKHNGDRVLRAPQYHSSTPTSNGGPTQTSRKLSGGGPGGKFGFGSSDVTTVTSPTRRVIARPAPKPPAQAAGGLAKRPEHTRTTPPLKHTSSAGAIVDGNQSSSLATKSNIPTSAKGPTAESGTRVFDAVDGSRISKLSASPSKIQPKEQLRRISSNPIRSEQQKSTTEVVQTKLQVLSTSSHRILHTSEDGGGSKRRPSLKTGYYTGSHSRPQKPPPMKVLPPSQTATTTSAVDTTQLREIKSAGEANTTSRTYDTPSPSLSPVEPPISVSSAQDKKPSELQSLSGAYDRLSPVELAAIRQISQEATVQPISSRQPVHRQISATSSDSEPSSQPVHRRVSAASTEPSNQPAHRRVSAASTETSSQPVHQRVSTASTKPSSQPAHRRVSATSSNSEPSSQPVHQRVSTASTEPSNQPAHRRVSAASAETSSQPVHRRVSAASTEPSSQPAHRRVSAASTEPSSQPAYRRVSAASSGSESESQPMHRRVSAASTEPSSQPAHRRVSTASTEPSNQPAHRRVSAASSGSESESQPMHRRVSAASTEPSSQPAHRRVSTASTEPSNQPAHRRVSAASSGSESESQPMHRRVSAASTEPSSQPAHRRVSAASTKPSSQPAYRRVSAASTGSESESQPAHRRVSAASSGSESESQTVHQRKSTPSFGSEIISPALSELDEKQRLTKQAFGSTNHSNLPVISSKSSSHDLKLGRRRHSSEEKYRYSPTSSIPQKSAIKTSGSRVERSTQSPSSSSTATLSSPEPLSDCQTPDSDEKRARLDNMNWSKQSLDKNLNTVATSTVQALSTLIEVLTPDPASKLTTHFKYDTPPLNPNWYTETDDSDSSSYPLSPLSPDPTSSNEATLSPRGKSPLTTSISDSSISYVTKSEPRVVQRVRFADNPVEILSASSRKVVSKTVPVTKETRVSAIALSKHASTRAGKSEEQSSKSGSPQQVKSSSHQKVVSQREEESISSHLGSSKDGIEVNGRVSTEINGNGLLNGMDSSTHDYATIEPKFHDYAILDPEYHSEFFGYCQRCTKPVIGMDTGCFALDCIYHLKCFTCSKCSTPLSGLNFYTADDQVLCEKDYWSLLETCHLCSLRIQDRVLRALDRSYHPDCFRCSTCKGCLDGVPYISDASNTVYCIPDYHKKYAPRCAVCDKPILPEQGKSRSLRVRTMDKSYHVECYKCESCRKQLASKSGGSEKCYPIDNHLFCKRCSLKHTGQRHSTKSRVPRPVISTSLL